MKTQEITTTDLTDFGSRERSLLIDLLTAWKEQGLPYDFHNEEVIPMLNKKSGCVFLTNSEFQAATMNGDNLEIWNNCWNCGNEGFIEDCQINEEGCNECSKDK